MNDNSQSKPRSRTGKGSQQGYGNTERDEMNGVLVSARSDSEALVVLQGASVNPSQYSASPARHFMARKHPCSHISPVPTRTLCPNYHSTEFRTGTRARSQLPPNRTSASSHSSLSYSKEPTFPSPPPRLISELPRSDPISPPSSRSACLLLREAREAKGTTRESDTT